LFFVASITVNRFGYTASYETAAKGALRVAIRHILESPDHRALLLLPPTAYEAVVNALSASASIEDVVSDASFSPDVLSRIALRQCGSESRQGGNRCTLEILTVAASLHVVCAPAAPTLIVIIALEELCGLECAPGAGAAGSDVNTAGLKCLNASIALFAGLPLRPLIHAELIAPSGGADSPPWIDAVHVVLRRAKWTLGS
jgi:hypothetical protein